MKVTSSAGNRINRVKGHRARWRCDKCRRIVAELTPFNGLHYVRAYPDSESGRRFAEIDNLAAQHEATCNAGPDLARFRIGNCPTCGQPIPKHPKRPS